MSAQDNKILLLSMFDGSEQCFRQNPSIVIELMRAG
jgi:hypothetical protein